MKLNLAAPSDSFPHASVYTIYKLSSDELYLSHKQLYRVNWAVKCVLCIWPIQVEQWAADPPGEQFGVQCLAQGSHLSRGQFLPEPRFEPTTSGYKSNALSIRPWLPRALCLYRAEVLNSSPRAPPLCIFCMSLLVNTPDSDNQLVRSALRAWTVFRLTCSLHSVHCSLLPEQGNPLKFTSLQNIH